MFHSYAPCSKHCLVLDPAVWLYHLAMPTQLRSWVPVVPPALSSAHICVTIWKNLLPHLETSCIAWCRAISKTQKSLIDFKLLVISQAQWQWQEDEASSAILEKNKVVHGNHQNIWNKFLRKVTFNLGTSWSSSSICFWIWVLFLMHGRYSPLFWFPGSQKLGAQKSIDQWP